MTSQLDRDVDEMKRALERSDKRVGYITDDDRIDMSEMTDRELIAYGEILRQKRAEQFRNEELPLLAALAVSALIVIGLIYFP
jgi:hypothetical protein